MTICGHVHDFLELCDLYSQNNEWVCPSCQCRLDSLKQIKVFKRDDLHIDKKELATSQIIKPQTIKVE